MHRIREQEKVGEDMEPTVDLFYVEQGEGIPIVFLHGYPLDHRIWLPVFPHLRKDIHIIAPDLRGHGRSPVPGGVYSMALMAEDVIRLLDRLKIEKVVIAGHSMGGYVTFKLWQLFPERILGLALVATRATADSEERRLDRLRTAEDMVKEGTTKVVNNMLTKLTKKTVLYPQVKEIMDGITPQGIAGILRGIADRENATPWLPQITVPVVVIAGKEDQLVPVEESIEMAKKLPNGELEVIDQAGHLPMMEDPAKVGECINDLIRRVGMIA
jgi:pimeloyl-ACP methyl ester carboxylesterase